jgi:hypothetical protein
VPQIIFYAIQQRGKIDNSLPGRKKSVEKKAQAQRQKSLAKQVREGDAGPKKR